MTLLEKTVVYVSSELTNNLPDHFVYHNLVHTRRVVDAVKEITTSETVNISEEDAQLVELAAWFHDIGFWLKN